MKGLSVLNNGAQIYDLQRGAMRVERALPRSATRDILETLQDQNVNYAVQDGGVDYWFEDGNYFAKQSLDRPYLVNNRLLVPNFVLQKPFYVSVQEISPEQVLALKDIGAQYQAQNVAVSIVHESIRDGQPKTFDVFFADYRANKETVLEVVAELSGIDTTNIMMTGDGRNDAGIIGAAGVGVAMGNAAKETMEAATYIAPDWQHDGAAIALEELVITPRK